MVYNAADELAALRAEKAQSNLENISSVAQLLPLSPFFSLKQYYLDLDLK